MSRRNIYLDYAATAPTHPAILKAMAPYVRERFGNPSSLHSYGQEAKAALDHARESIAGLLRADFREIIFTGSATEANNTALFGVVQSARARGIKTPRIILSSVEHESLREPSELLKKWGVDVLVLPVDSSGKVRVDVLSDLITKETVFVSVIFVQNEVGTVEPIEKMTGLLCEVRERSRSIHSPYPIVHADAVQAFQYLDCTPSRLGVDLMTLSAHKLQGPKGVGLLYRSNRVSSHIYPLLHGGGQEFGMRAGTEAVAEIVGLRVALERAAAVRTREKNRLASLKDFFIREFMGSLPHEKCAVNGPPPSEGIPHIVNLYFPRHTSEDLLFLFDQEGIAVSAGSACSTRSLQPSYVIEALGYSRERARRSIRFSFGGDTNETLLKEALQRIQRILQKQKKNVL